MYCGGDVDQIALVPTIDKYELTCDVCSRNALSMIDWLDMLGLRSRRPDKNDMENKRLLYLLLNPGMPPAGGYSQVDVHSVFYLGSKLTKSGFGRNRGGRLLKPHSYFGLYINNG
jgi:hypothetical protein